MLEARTVADERTDDREAAWKKEIFVQELTWQKKKTRKEDNNTLRDNK